MSTRYRGLWLAVVVFAALVLVGGACTNKPDAQISVAGVTNLDSLTLRDNLVVGKATTLGSGGLAVTGPFTMSNGAIINSKGAVTVTDQLFVTSQVNAANGVNATGSITASANVDVGVDLVMHGGNIWDDADDVDFLDDVEISNKLTVDSQIVAANGIAAAGGITSTGAVSVTSWGLFYGVALQPAVTQIVTANYGITPTSYSVMYLADDGGQATNTIDLDASVGIVNGTKPQQLLIIVWNDSDGALLKIVDNSNVQFPADKYLTLAYLDAAIFMWHGTDWVYLGGGVLN